jgi:NAD(P)-dependent dehydrogenase (short-subunit alcohol dehydrogenase family)
MSEVGLNSLTEPVSLIAIDVIVWLMAVILLLIQTKIYWRGGICNIREDIAGRIVVITGAAQLRQQNSSYSITYIPLDLGNRQTIHKFVEEVIRLHSHIDILVNNAGIMGTRTRLLTDDGIERQLAINYLGHFLLTHKLLPLLKESDRPRICNLASMAYSNVIHTN